MKVLLLAEAVALPDGTVPPHGSGAHLAADLSGLRDHFDVLPIIGEASSGESAPSSSRSVARRVLPGWVRGLRQDLLALRSDRAFTKRAMTAASSFSPDVVYARSEYLGLSGVRVAKQLRIPLILEVNGLLAQDVKSMYRSPLEPLGAAVERLKHRRADAIVTVSPGLARRLENIGAPSRKLVVIPNSVSPTRVRQNLRERSTRDVVVIGWVGHLMRWHLEALGFLIDVAPEVLRQAPQVRFLVIGGGPGIEGLETRVQFEGLTDRFRFEGIVAHEAVPERLAEVDIGVIPAVFDYALPVKLVEYGAAGIPVVAPRSASLDEQLGGADQYVGFRPADPAALTAALVRLALDPDERARLGEALRLCVQRRFTWAATGSELAELINHVVETDRKGGITTPPDMSSGL